MLAVGDKLPTFSIVNQDGKVITNKDFLNNYTVLYFYPRDNTPGCTTEASDFTSKLKCFEKLNTSVYGVSTDSVASHKKFVKAKQLKIDLLADENNKLCELFGVWKEKKMYGKTFMGVVRTTFIISPGGLISYRFDKVKVKGHVDKVENMLENILRKSVE